MAIDTEGTNTGRLIVGPALEPMPPALPPAQYTAAERLQQWRGQVETMAREDPVKTLAIALAAGFVVGKLLHFVVSRPKRRRELEIEIEEDD